MTQLIEAVMLVFWFVLFWLTIREKNIGRK